MHFGRVVLLSFLLWSASNLDTAKSQETELLQNAIKALYNGLQYMEDHVSEINLDGAFGCRLVEDLFHSFLESRPEVFESLSYHLRDQLEILRAKAGRIADEAKHSLKISEPLYYAALGALLEESEVLMWYPSRITKSSLQVQPLPCSESVFNESLSDQCLQEILGSRNDKINRCHLSKECLDMMTRPKQRGYMITHQVLYFQLMEMKNCLTRSHVKEIPESLQDALCSNVMRDAEEIVSSGYPLNHRDLFMEQIGLCGLWGYRDFYKQQWLEDILQWQQKSGCYANRARWHCTENLSQQNIRVKRQEKILEDGCLSHKTTVALLAIAANIRFSVEEISKAM